MLENYWYKNVVIYAIDVKSFFDSNNDGMGDLKGVTSKLPYLSSLGVTCLWLLPFYPSPLMDNGYDISDYYQVDPRLGTLDDFSQLVRESSQRGIRVIIDVVMNHTSSEHPWFVASKKNPHSLYRNYYIWKNPPPVHNSFDLPAFPDTEETLWKFDQEANSFYYHKFYHFQPDLNMANPIVQDEVKKVMDFWFSFGISGVRLDAVPVMLQPKGDLNAKFLRPDLIFSQMRKVIEKTNPSSILVGEVDVDGDQLIDYFADGNGLQLIFNFILNAYLMASLIEKKAEILIQGWRELPVVPESCGWLNFLRNLDELNLYQLPKNLKEKVLAKIAPETQMRIYSRGVRRRLATMLQGEQNRIAMGISLLFSLPGTPLITYGDEIGMGENLNLWEREAVRTPMQWDNSINGGFSKIDDGNKLFRHLVKDDEYSFQKINIQNQLDHHSSLLMRVRDLIRCRRNHPEIGFGKLEWVEINHPSVLAHVCHWKNSLLLAVHNLSELDLNVQMNFKTFFAKEFVNIIGKITIKKISKGEYSLDLAPYDYGWFRVILSPKESFYE